MPPIEQAREALKPCPFCGGLAELRSEANRHFVACVDDDECAAEGHCAHVDEYAIECWNRRAPSTPVDGVGAEPRVKPLEWDGDFAHTSFGLFYFLVEEDDGYLLQRYDGTLVAKSFHGLRDDAIDAAQADYDKRILSALANPEAEARLQERVADCAMTPEEHRLEDLKQMAGYAGPIVSFDTTHPYYLASCDNCGWVGSSELCGTDSWGDDSDVYCPRCHASGADCGKVAEKIGTAEARLAQAEGGPAVTEALKPFAEFARNEVEWVGDCWVWKHGRMRERICDWFGPSDFGAALHPQSAAGEEGK